MPGSDAGSSTTRHDQYLDITTKAEISAAESSEKASVMEKNSVERVSSRENSDIDIEKGGAEVTIQPVAPPGINPDDFPDVGLEAVSTCYDLSHQSSLLFSGDLIL